MAELSIKATLQGAAEAQRGIDALSASMGTLNGHYENEATILSNLARAGEEYRRGIADKTAATQQLKEHTADLVRQFQAQEDAERQATSTAAKLSSSIGDMAFNFATTTFSVAALGATFHQIVSLGREADLSIVKLDASLAATGSSVGFTRTQLQGMAEDLAHGTRFDNTSMQQAISVLLTFDNVQGETFRAALQNAQNLSEKFGIDLTGAARLLGRALQEPGLGLETLRRYIGAINPEILKHIKNLNDMGDTAGAQAEMIRLLDSRMKGFAETVGSSAPASVDQFVKSWKNLLEALGEGQSGKIATFWAKTIDNVTGYLKNWDAIRRGIEIDTLNRMIGDANTSTADRVKLQGRMLKLMEEQDLAYEHEQQAQNDAILASKVHGWEEEEVKAKAFREKQLKENEELIKKIEADEEAATRKRVELMNIEVKEGTLSLNDKVKIIEEQMQFEARGTTSWITLMNERERTLDAVDKAEKRSTQNTLARYDLDIKQGYATFQQKIRFIDELLSHETKESDYWLFLMQQRQRTEDEELAKQKQNEAKKREELAKTQRFYADLAEEQIAKIRNTVYPDEDAKIAALHHLGEVYQGLGEDGEKAFDKINKAIAHTQTAAERQTKRLQEILGLATFDMVNVVGAVNTSWQNTFAQMLHGTMSLSDGLRSLWKGIVDGIIQEIARLVARWLAAQAIMGLGSFLGGAGIFGGIFGAGGAGVWTGTGAGAADLATTAIFLAGGGDMVVTKPTTFAVGEGGAALSSIRGFQHGGEGLFTAPTLFRAGEGGPERVRVTPLAGGARGLGGGGAPVTVFSGINVMNSFTWRKFVREQERAITRERNRG